MIHNVLKVYNATKQFKKLICYLSIITINELSIVSILVANLLQFESRMFLKLIVIILRFIDGSWIRSEKLVTISFLKIKY